MGDWKEEDSFSWLAACKNRHNKAQAGCRGCRLALNTDSNSPRERTPRSCPRKAAPTSAGLCGSTFNSRIMETIFCFVYFLFFPILLLKQSLNFWNHCILLPQDKTGKIFMQGKERWSLFSFHSMLWLHRTGHNSITPHLPSIFECGCSCND